MAEENQTENVENQDSKGENGEATPDTVNVHNVENELLKTKTKELEEFKSKYFYLAAEMDNMRKRNAREMEQISKFGMERILSSLVSVVDNFDRTSQALNKDQDDKVKNILVGISMVRNQFMQVLSENGLTTIESVGKNFDPNLHEAIGQKIKLDIAEDTILEEFEKGYLLNGRLLRAAKVLISKKE